MRNTKQIGDISVAKITAALLSKGYIILTPYGDNQRYDLVIDKQGTFERIQCKTAWDKGNGSFKFNTKSVSSNGKIVRGYQGEIEYFAVYYPTLDKCYLIPVSETGKSAKSFPVDETKVRKNFKSAKEFEV